MAAVDYFLKIDGISGESTDAKHKGEIEVESFSWGVSNTATARGAGGGAGRAQFSDFAFMARTSTASPELFLKCASGQHITKAVLTAQTAGDEPDQFLQITLDSVLVSTYQISGGGDQPTDASGLRYESLQFVEGAPQHIGITPAATGMLRYDPKTRQVTFVEGPANVLTVGSIDGGVQRGVQEFDITDLLGLLTAPFSTAHLRLTVSEVRDAVTNPPTIASVSTDSVAEASPPHLFDVILYTPADGAIEPADLYRPGRQKPGRVFVDPNAPPATLEMDLTEIVSRHQLGAFGIRIQLQGLGLPELDAPDDTANADSESPDDAKRAPFSASFSLDLALDTA